MNINNIDVNKLAIIIFVGIGAIAGIIFNQENITSVCFGGLIGYLSKEYTSTETIAINPPTTDIKTEDKEKDTEIEDGA